MDRNRTKKYVGFALSELAWGMLLALFLQCTRPGRRLARCRAWLAVVIGVAGTGAIALLIVPLVTVLRVALAFTLSSIGIVARALANEYRLERTLLCQDKSPPTGSVGLCPTGEPIVTRYAA